MTNKLNLIVKFKDDDEKMVKQKDAKEVKSIKLFLLVIISDSTVIPSINIVVSQNDKKKLSCEERHIQ